MSFPLLGLLLSLHLLLLTLFNKVFLSSRGVGRRLRPSGKGCRQEPKGQQQTHEVRGLQALGEGQWREQRARGGRTKESNRKSVYQEEKIVSDLLTLLQKFLSGGWGQSSYSKDKEALWPLFLPPSSFELYIRLQPPETMAWDCFQWVSAKTGRKFCFYPASSSPPHPEFLASCLNTHFYCILEGFAFRLENFHSP